MRPEYEHKSAESAAREKAHQFGQPGGNKPGMPSAAGAMRAFYRWAENEATEDELKAYIKDAKNPYTRRRFVAALVKCNKVQDFFDLTNQTHGLPKQVIEQTNLPEVKIVLE